MTGITKKRKMTKQTMRTEQGYIQVEELFNPIRNAKQKTIVEVVDNKTKMRIERRSPSAQELI